MDATSAVALAGLVIALGSAGFSWYTWWSGGSRLRISDQDGYILDRERGLSVTEPSELPAEDPVYVVDAENGFMRIYRLVNVGRQAIAVLDVWIDEGGPEHEGMVIPTETAQLSEVPPVTIEPGHLLQIAIAHEFLRQSPWSGKGPNPRLAAQLGTGRIVYSDPRGVPDPKR